MSTIVNISALAATSLDYAQTHIEEIFSEALAPGMGGIAGTPVKPLDYYCTTFNTFDEVVLTNVNVSAEVRPSTFGGFEPKAGEVAKIEPRVARVKPCKMDLLFTQAQIMAYWQTYYGLKKAKKIDPTTFPFEQFIMQKIALKIQTDIRTKAYPNGVRNNAGTGALDIMDGLFKKTNDYVVSGLIPAGNITIISAVTAANAVDQFEKLVENIPAQHFYGGLVVLTTAEKKRKYEKDYRTKYGTTPYNAGFDKQEIEGSTVEFCVEPGFAPTGATAFDIGLVTTLGNIAWLYDDESAFTGFEVDYSKRDRSLAYMMDFQIGMDIVMPTEVWLGDVV